MPPLAFDTESEVKTMSPRSVLACFVPSVMLLGCSPIFGVILEAAESNTETIAVGESVAGSTEGARDNFRPPCAQTSDEGGDNAYTFVPEQSGIYRLSVEAGYDSVLAIFDREGNPIACNDDHGRTNHSQIESRLESGAQYTIVVDGFGGARGTYVLNVEAVQLEAPSTPGNTLALGATVNGDTRGRPDERTPPCGNTRTSPDQTWIFTPPEDGVYEIAIASEFEGVLAVYPQNGDQPLGCNDGHTTSRLSLQLDGGQAYEVVVDGDQGAAGAYRLSVVSAGAATTPGGRTLQLNVTAQGDTRTGGDTHTPGCGTRPGSPDQVWTFTPPRSGRYRLHVDAGYDSVLAVYERGSTQPIQCNDDFGSTRVSRLDLPLSSGQTYEVVVDGWSGRSGPYRLTATELVTQTPTTASALTVGQPVNGSTSGRPDTITPPCGSRPGSPDQTWTFTPPVNGMYRFHVDSGYDATLGVYQQNNPAPMVCNDDFQSTRAARVEASLSAGQTYRVVVDGYYGAQGSYRLRVDMITPNGQVAPPPPPPARVENITAVESRCGNAPLLRAGFHAGRLDASQADVRTSCAGGGAGGEAIYRVRVQQDSILQVRVESAATPIVELRSGCSRGHTAVACDGAGNDPRRATLSARLTAGQDYFLVVDNVTPAEDATFTLDVEIRPVGAGGAGGGNTGSGAGTEGGARP